MYFALIGVLAVMYIVWFSHQPDHRIERWDW
jgi:hypothetical protein